jgi:hypothetical protein
VVLEHCFNDHTTDDYLHDVSEIIGVTRSRTQLIQIIHDTSLASLFILKYQFNTDLVKIKGCNFLVIVVVNLQY